MLYDTYRKYQNLFQIPLKFVPLNRRYGGKDFVETYKFLKESDKWTQEQYLAYQKKELKNLLEYVVKKIPFYQDIKLKSSDPFKNLERFPKIKKEIVQQDIDKFLSVDKDKMKHFVVTTGGTSGNTLKIYLDNSTYGKEWAYKIVGWERAGFRIGNRMISFRGVNFKNTKGKKFWQFNAIYNWLEMSPFDLNDTNNPYYIKKIKSFKPDIIHGYPSALSQISKYILDHNIKIEGVKDAIGISENIYPEQRDIISRAFNCKFFSFYGASEKVILAPECEYDSRYHAFPQYGITEFIDEDGNPTEKGELGELVGTGFMNRIMPFIRYRMGDFGRKTDNKCKCGRNHVIIQDLMGRWEQDMVRGYNGTKISVAALNLHSDVLKKVERYQYYQDKEGLLLVKIQPKETINQLDRSKIIQSLKEKVRENLDIEIEQCEEIPLTGIGKFKRLVIKKNN